MSSYNRNSYKKLGPGPTEFRTRIPPNLRNGAARYGVRIGQSRMVYTRKKKNGCKLISNGEIGRIDNHERTTHVVNINGKPQVIVKKACRAMACKQAFPKIAL